jgi:hypothetical protein
MAWTILFHDDFAGEFRQWSREAQRSAAHVIAALEVAGPGLGRPQVDTLQGSKHRNMKELRFATHDGEWRIAFAFDRQRQAILLVGGSKAGMASVRFYRRLIAIADQRFDEHLSA